MGLSRIGMIFMLILVCNNVPLNTHAQIHSIKGKNELQPNQTSFTTMNVRFLSFIGNQNGHAALDNTITFEKVNSSQDINILLDGNFFSGNDQYRDKVYFTLFGPDGRNITYYERGEDHIQVSFLVHSNDDNGVYKILVDLGPIPPPSEPLNCCSNYLYEISYSGLSQPPMVQGLSSDVGMEPSYGFIPIPHLGSNLTFTFFGYPGSFIFYQKPGDGVNNVIVNATLIDSLNNTQSLVGNPTNQGFVLFNFDLNTTGYARIVLQTNQDQNLYGKPCFYKLVENTVDYQGGQKILNLFINGLGNFDSDFDLIPDFEEMKIGTDPHLADSDGDHVNDGLEIRFGTNPLDSNSNPIDISSVVYSNVDTHKFDITIKIQSPETVFSEVSYLINLNPKFTPYTPDSVSGSYTASEAGEIQIEILTKNEGQQQLSFPFGVQLGFSLLNGSETTIFQFSNGHVKPELISDTNGVPISSTPQLPVAFPFLSTFLSLVAILPISRRFCSSKI